MAKIDCHKKQLEKTESKTITIILKESDEAIKRRQTIAANDIKQKQMRNNILVKYILIGNSFSRKNEDK